MNHRRRKGEPLVALAAIATGWIGVRIMTWTSPFAAETATPELHRSAQSDRHGRQQWPDTERPAALIAPSPAIVLSEIAQPPRVAVFRRPGCCQTALQARDDAALPTTAIGDPRHKSGLATTAQEPPSLPIASPTTATERRGLRRWSVDAWAMLREGSGGSALSVAAGPGAYGRSQAGVVARWRLMSGGPKAPYLYARASKALVPRGESELAAGVGIKPVAMVPLTVQGELRVTQFPERTALRPSIFAVMSPAPMDLSEAGSIEVYAQAGYVGGTQGSLFADGHARAEHRVAKMGGAEFRAGVGAWGGAQEGAARLDIGPTASARFALAEVPLRLALDYRARVVGDAEPGSGVTVTLSGGF